MKKKVSHITIALFVIMVSCNDISRNEKTFVGKRVDYFKIYKNNLLYDRMFYLSKKKSLFEYQGDLFKFFPRLNSADSVKIREMCFDISRQKMYLWFKFENNYWIVIDESIVKKNENF